MRPRLVLAPAQLDPAAYPRKLNLGSGTDPRDDYLNVDLNAFNTPDLLADVRELDFLPAQYYDEILAQDVLEHLPRTQTLQALAHWNRLLKMGGTIVLRVPSVLGLADLLRHPDYQEPSKQEDLIQHLFGTQAYTGDFHFTSFTPVLLRHYLAQAGFEITRLDVLLEWNFDVTAVKVRHIEALEERDFSGLLATPGDEEFVRACYRQILRREPDSAGREFFLGGLRAGGLSRQTMIQSLLASGEYRVLRSLVTHYYQSILRRAPDTRGRVYWEDEAARMAALGADLNEVWFAMAMQFFASPEYLAFDRGDEGYVDDLYRAFFDRESDVAGREHWVRHLAQGTPREVLLAQFMFSAEFRQFTRAFFGETPARAEVDMIMDFYRGLLGRLPDEEGFGYWLERFRTAQATGSVKLEADAISRSFIGSPEYGQRARTDAQFVGDLYNAFLRRGADLDGLRLWIERLESGAASRDELRAEFLSSAEFQARLREVSDAGAAGRLRAGTPAG